MLVHSASQLITLAGGPQRGDRLGDLGLIEDGGIVFREGKILETGSSTDLMKKYPEDKRIDASNTVVIPGFVDPHTHVIWAGDRSVEFEQRLQGKTYLEIMEGGGGINSTVEATRNASLSQLKENTRDRLRASFAHGTTTIEAKTGYGLNSETELKMLQALLELNQEEPQDIIFTFLGAHAIPPEYEGNSDGYTGLVCDELIPTLAEWWPKQTSKPFPYVDVFCETGAFNLNQSRQILETAQKKGFPIKIHADEFNNLGGVNLAVELKAVSADHLVVTSQDEIKALGKSNTIAVALPCTPFGLSESDYTPARDILNAGGYLAIATDLNPGTAWCENMQFAVALSCRYMKLTPNQAIAAATINAAAAVGMEEIVGSLDPGKLADLVILDIPDYRHLGYRFGTNLVKYVIKRGNVFKPQEVL